ncbi:hypothetical protein AHAS_Ahas20G0110800 [Arachis hypogaea]
MSSSRNKEKQPATDLQRNQQQRPLRFLKPIISPPSFKLALPIGPDKLPSGAPYMTLVVPDGRCIGHRCFWKQQQNDSIALTHSMLLFKHKGNSEFQVRIFDFSGCENTYRPRPSKEPPYEAKGTYRRARCINNPSSHKAKAIAQTHKTKWSFFVMDLTDRVLHSHLDTRSSCHTDTLRSRQPTPDLVASETVASGSSPEAEQTLLACANSSPEVWGSSRSCPLSQSQYCRSDVATMLQAPDSSYYPYKYYLTSSVGGVGVALLK